METHSQASQDIFVRYILGDKKGYFLEIGSSDPILYNNSYVLEKMGWKGIMIEYDSNYLKGYKKHRTSEYIINDARTINYKDILKSYPKNMDYLQIDLDVDNKSTLDVLNILDETIFDDYKFATITFEHDFYRGDFFDTRKISREIFKKRGYLLVFPDIRHGGPGTFFEDLYVHPDLVNMNKVNKIITDKSLNYLEVRNVMI